MTTTRFFVYGSLSEGMVHFSKIQSFIESSVPAQIRGHLLEIRSSELLVGLLDEFFGFNQIDRTKSLYHREESLVSVDGRGLLKAWVYFLNPAKLPATAAVIDGGDWQKSMEEAPALTEKLSDRQKGYITKLGGSSGREIVPIDLQLYRELMNLELIVDKGRRLALSKLGHEVYRHLG
jgi:gamma-glutamylcyclotransferase (GGCT)/AIG2-like uncharacterized protein YtfP